MSEEFLLSIKPFSINAMFYRDGKIKTATYREWEALLIHELSTSSNLKKLKSLHDSFDVLKHVFSVQIIAYFPKDTYWNKEGKLSARTQDVTNFEKPLVDVFFNPSYARKQYPYGLANIQHDDRYVFECISKKKPKEGSHQVSVSIKILPKELVEDNLDQN